VPPKPLPSTSIKTLVPVAVNENHTSEVAPAHEGKANALGLDPVLE
jgi:hypothetical protein